MTNKYDSAMERLKYYYVEGERHRPTQPEDVEAFERTIGYKLPPDYREFLIKYGITGTKGRMTTSDSSAGVEVFLGLNPGTRRPGASYDLSGILDGLDVPQHFLPIATSPGGLTGLYLAGANAGKVCWFDPHGGSEALEDDTSFIADDFGSFMNSLILKP